MVLLRTADSALEVAHEIARITPETISKLARKIYTALVGTSLEVMRERDYSPNTSQVVFFACAESVALSVGCHPSTLYRKLPELHEAGLVDARGHFCTHNGQTRLDGTVWSVRLTPNWGRAARVPLDYLKKSYRCLGDDIDAGRTAFAQMRESLLLQDKSDIRIDHILRWALSVPSKKPVILTNAKTQRFDLESIFDVPHAPKSDRAEMVYNAAKAMSNALNDSSSTRFYCAVLWGLLRLRDRGAGDYFATLHLMVSRARADVTEGFSRKGGAVLTARLKKAPFWELMRSLKDKPKA